MSETVWDGLAELLNAPSSGCPATAVYLMDKSMDSLLTVATLHCWLSLPFVRTQAGEMEVTSIVGYLRFLTH